MLWRAVYVLVSLAIGGGLVYGLVRAFPVDFDFEGLRTGFFAAVIASTAVHFGLMAWKWKLLTEHVDPITEPFTRYYAYTALGGVLAQILPLQIVTVTVRSIALKVHHKVSMRKSGALAVFDQFLDVAIPFLIFVPGLMLGLGWIGWGTAAGLAILALVLGFVVLRWLGFRLIVAVLRIVGRFPGLKRFRLTEELLENFQQNAPRRTRILLDRLYLFSVIKYANLALRFMFVSFILQPAAGPLPVVVFFATALIVLATILAFTPASLGVTEWSWVGVLTLFGMESAAAAEFALLSRVAVLSSVLAVGAAVVITGILRRR